MRVLSGMCLAALLLGVNASWARAADPELQIKNQLDEEIEVTGLGIEACVTDTVTFPKVKVKPSTEPAQIGKFPKGKYRVKVIVGDQKAELDFDIQKDLRLLVKKKDDKILILID